jgi:hypothetical protein
MLAVAQAAGMPEDRAAQLSAYYAERTFDAVWRYLNRHVASSWLLLFDTSTVQPRSPRPVVPSRI